MKTRKGQIKMMETISVLLIFLILLTFVVLFYVNVSTSTQGQTLDERGDLKAVQIAQLISHFPEFQCSSRNIVTENCFDMLKIDSFKAYVETDRGQRSLNTVYFDSFGYSHITVEQIFPSKAGPWVIYSRQPELERYNNRTVFIPLSLYDPVQNTYSFGLLNVTVHS